MGRRTSSLPRVETWARDRQHQAEWREVEAGVVSQGPVNKGKGIRKEQAEPVEKQPPSSGRGLGKHPAGCQRSDGRAWEVRWGPLSHPSRRRGGLRDQERGGSSQGKEKYLLALWVNLWRKLIGLDLVPPQRAVLPQPVLRLHHSRAGTADRRSEAAGAELGVLGHHCSPSGTL